MSFGNSSLFPFPAVQYIPLSITNILTGKLHKPSVKTSIPPLIPGDALTVWRPKLLSDLGITIPETFPHDQLPVLAVNLNVKDVKYRSYYVTLLSELKPDYFQLFSIPKNRFYKKQLYFELFDEISGKRLACYSLFKPSVNINSK